MKINVKPVEFQEKGVMFRQILRVPDHLNTMRQIMVQKNWHYPNGIQPGFIVRPGGDGESFFCRYWQWDTETGHYETELRTKLNSESTPVRNLYYWNYHAQELVVKAFEEALDIRMVTK